MTESVFSFPGGAANAINQVITSTAATIIVLGNQPGQHNIAWFRCNEYAGGTPNLSVEIYDTVNAISYWQGANGFTWNATPMTALQSVLFEDGYVVPNGYVLRVKSSVANSILVTGIYVGKQATTPWQGPNK